MVRRGIWTLVYTPPALLIHSVVVAGPQLSETKIGRLDSNNRQNLLDEWPRPSKLLYTMDILGNITTLNRKNTAVDASETRTYNATNELTSRTVPGEAARYWVSDDFADNDKVGWAIANVGTGSGTWSASSGKLHCTGVQTATGAPDGGTGSILLIDGQTYQDVLITVDAKMNANCDNAGIVFGYVDNQNYWVQLYSKAQQTVFVYQVSSGTWTQRASVASTINAGTTYTLSAQARGGLANWYAATVPAGQVGIWCGDSSDNEFDNFKVLDIAGPYVIDAKWFTDLGGSQIDAGNSNVLELNTPIARDGCAVRRGCRVDKYVATVKFYWNGTTEPGFVVRWLSPGDWLAVTVRTSGWMALYKRQADGAITDVAWSGSALSLSTSTWYTMKVLVDDDPGNSALQRLRCWVDTDGDGDFSDETVYLDTTAVDDVWSAGYVGVFRYLADTAVTKFDDFKVGTNNGSGGFGTMLVDDNFNSNQVSLSYDDNGNLTDDGVLHYVYDAWNRLRLAKLVVGNDSTTIGTYVYLPDNRRASKVVANSGVEATPNDGGNTTLHYYYSNKWQILEERNGSNQSLRQYVWGSQYVDELVLIDVNGDQASSNDCDPDVSAGGESGQDRRYFVHQDRNWNVLALTEYADGAGTNGRIKERYAYTPYGEFVVLKGDAGSGDLGSVLATSIVGNVFVHEGLPFDQDKGGYQNRHRRYAAPLQRFVGRDPMRRRTEGNPYLYAAVDPLGRSDPSGLSADPDPVTQPVIRCTTSCYNPDAFDTCVQEICIPQKAACDAFADSTKSGAEAGLDAEYARRRANCNGSWLCETCVDTWYTLSHAKIMVDWAKRHAYCELEYGICLLGCQEGAKIAVQGKGCPEGFEVIYIDCVEVPQEPS